MTQKSSKNGQKKIICTDNVRLSSSINHLIKILAKQTSFGPFSYYELRPGQPQRIQQAFRGLFHYLFSGVYPIGRHIFLF